MSEIERPAPDEPVIDAEALKKAEVCTEAEQGATNGLCGALGVFVAAVAVVMSVFHLYTAYAIVPTQTLRPVHVGFVLFLVYLLFPAAKRYRHRVMWWDWACALAAVAASAHVLPPGGPFRGRNNSPNQQRLLLACAVRLPDLDGHRLR